MISSATLKCPTNRAKKTISCSSVNLMFSPCIILDQFTVSNHFNYVNTKSRNTLRKPCPSPSYSTRETGKPFSFKAWKIVLACFGGTAYKVKLDLLFKLILKFMKPLNTTKKKNAKFAYCVFQSLE